MSHTSRPLKRLRDKEDTSETSPDFLKALKRSEEFWIPDGNIVLVAGQTAFRVYRGLLAMQSTIFADLFASSSPTAEETYDDCPLIRLTESPQDLAHLLRLLLPTSRMLLQRRESDPQLSLHQISAIIRLAHKYHIEDLLDQALYVLQDSLPATFSKWADLSRIPLVNMDDGGLIAVVNLARLTDTPRLLPVALYECCSLGEDLVDGWTREDGTVEYLSPADLKRCIYARSEFSREAFALASIIFDSRPSNDCTTPDLCTASLHNYLTWLMRDGSLHSSTMLECWGYYIRAGARPRNKEGYCAACEGELVGRAQRETERIWNRLPEIFDVEVPNWN